MAVVSEDSAPEQKNNKKSEEVKPKRRSKIPGVRIVGCRIYDSENGKTCHQCRQKTMDYMSGCKNLKNDKPCAIKFCHKCLLNRYGEKAEEVTTLEDWKCPKCRDICNCSFCMKKRGFQPTGILVHTAKATGYTSVSEMLQGKAPENTDHEKVVKNKEPTVKKTSASEKVAEVVSPTKSGKENMANGSIGSNAQLTSSHNPPEQESRKKKRKERKEIKCTGGTENVPSKVIANSPDKKKFKKMKQEGSQQQSCLNPKRPSSDGSENVSSKVIANSPDKKKFKKMKQEGLQQQPSLNPKRASSDGTENVSSKANANSSDKKKFKKMKQDGLPQQQSLNPKKASSDGTENVSSKGTANPPDKKKFKKMKQECLQQQPSLNPKRASSDGTETVSSKGIANSPDKRKSKKMKQEGLQQQPSLNPKSTGLTKQDGLQQQPTLNPKPMGLAKQEGIPNTKNPNDESFQNEGHGVCEVKKCVKEIMKKCEKVKMEVSSKMPDEDTVKDLGIKNINLNASIPLPQGSALKSVAGNDFLPEDVGSALQFLEFCAAFGKVLDLKKGQAEAVLRDLVQGRTSRRGKTNVTAQFLIQLLLVIEEEQEGSSKLSSTDEKGLWFNSLKELISESSSVSKYMGLDSLTNAADGFESLSLSRKLKLLNFVCDEVLDTVRIRDWIDQENLKCAEKAKEAREKVSAAREEEKRLKQKMQDDIAASIISKEGAPISLSEHDAIVSRAKLEAAEAHAALLETKSLLLKCNQRADAVRTEPVFSDTNGHVFWRLKCYSNKSDILLQELGTGDVASDEKWLTFDETNQETVEKCINSRRKRFMAPSMASILKQAKAQGYCCDKPHESVEN